MSAVPLRPGDSVSVVFIVGNLREGCILTDHLPGERSVAHYAHMSTIIMSYMLQFVRPKPTGAETMPRQRRPVAEDRPQRARM
jgi:hypothetical protein